MSAPALRRPLFLSGFMATGKTTIGRLVANRLGVPFLDTDALLAEETGRSVAELFAEGEARFREREAELVRRILADPTPRVIAFGGGTMTMPGLRHAALEAGTLVTLTASAPTIVSRVSSLAERPNLSTSSPLQRARDLLELRRDAYGECHASIPTETGTPEQLAARVIAVAEADALAMPLGTRTYAVELADGAPQRLASAIADLDPSSILVVTDENVGRARGPWLESALASCRVPIHTVTIVPGERSKTLTTVSSIWDQALGRGLDRDALVLAFGGGVVGDLAGFAASTLLRGVRCVQIATSLLAMVDSSVGGKTGFDHAAGKNLIGAFFQPSRVIVDLEHLVTLPERERAAGLAEIVKIALVQDAPLLARLERDAASIARGDRAVLREIVRLAIAAKIRVVRDDERESGARALLNLGHTVGHALEAHGGYEALLHGEAVAIGTVLEMEAAERLSHTPKGLASRAATLLGDLGLPTTSDLGDLRAAWPYVLTDKKRAAGDVKLPVVTAPGEGKVVRVQLDALATALRL
ncbi:MAG: 3-dehydroquinate synthase [Deltaproteobacteria bacterium]|nr:3-dehydroquinate synthase [Deltaproteobacteria bacterium]